MRRLTSLALLPAALACLPTTATAQTPYLVGTRDVAWPNTTGQGSSTLASRVLYPATQAGINTPVLPQASGWPAIVFLHGFAVLGNSYSTLGSAWAEAGFIVVLSNTMQFDNVGQEHDGRALFFAVQAANNTVGGPFANGLDLTRVAIAGHSMGGGNVANVLAINPGYRSGVAIAPVPARGNNGALVTVPLGVIAGTGDTVTPPASNAQPFYQSLINISELKFLYLLNADASHTNLAGLFLSGATATAVFARSVAVASGCLRHTLRLSNQSLEQAVGPAALAEPRLVSLSQQFAAPQVWTDVRLQPGATVRVSVGSEPGLGALAAAAGPLMAPLPTPFGDLYLAAATAFVAAVAAVGAERRFDVAVVVPSSPTLLGSVLALQALGPSAGQPVRLGLAIAETVQP